MVVPAGEVGQGMSDIVEESPSTSAAKDNEEGSKANGSSRDYAGSPEEDDEDEDGASEAGSGRKSTDRLLR